MDIHTEQEIDCAEYTPALTDAAWTLLEMRDAIRAVVAQWETGGIHASNAEAVDGMLRLVELVK